ncbi:type I-E CRISPR-associated protein Cas5/CasD [Mobiluncus mulieris]|uniref:type I-E CRISPR-associated protein Cas5/CasD n=1 Tax=Mobiluncus mulieris TaxID=2052 RepID=UPI00019F84DD|nr:type I-E CRISPR-associated protein Cas5/CasD [Mobiluncus mulieris]EEJ54446.1 CRISPR system CASCADE complex protein CasD [Mobiluncus mulieris ATCC 35243]MCV0001440.1 type I-E CRISPR-associated protein Cas5/CasD [Mobiluncus mulieris]SPX76226.1 CRISPR-associated protein Cas5/CasD, subtype I-E/ECOLI [Mobiluncus mulieris]
MTSVYIRLAGPLQSWAGAKVSGNISHTQDYPTRGSLEGLVAACLGCPRGKYPLWFQDLQFAVRVDSPGRICDDYQTIGVRDEDMQVATRLLTLLTGKRATNRGLAFIPDAQGKTTIVRRTLLADAEFIVQIQCEGHLEQLDQAISDPTFVSYLGRKAFAPGFPFYLGIGEDSAIDTLPVFDKGRLESSYYQEKPEPTAESEIKSRTLYRLSSIHTTQETIHPPLEYCRKKWLETISEQLRRRATV